MTRIALVPGVLALLPDYAGQVDPVPDLRAACLAAVAWLAAEPQIAGDAQGERVARALLRASVGDHSAPATDSSAWLVVANGTARRTQSSPGPYDDRAVPFDDLLAKALLAPDPGALRGLDQALARELWASTSALQRLADLLTGEETVTVDYEGAPHGVQYWVVRYDR